MVWADVSLTRKRTSEVVYEEGEVNFNVDISNTFKFKCWKTYGYIVRMKILISCFLFPFYVLY